MASSDSIELRLTKLVEAGAVPPFVYCYPPRSSYRTLPEPVELDDLWRADQRVSLTTDLNLYLHVPFCRYKCGFCNLYTVIATDIDLYDAYVDALCADIRRHAEVITSRRLATVYIGGGTPSLLADRHIAQLLGTLDEVYGNWRSGVEEVCIEATPDSIAEGGASRLELFKASGLTRINMGIQSLKRAELREAGRTRANEDVVRRAAGLIRESQMSNLSTDLIMGFDGQTDDTWMESVHELVSIGPETISTYFLTVRPDAWFSKTGKYQYQRDPALYARYDMAREAILGAGYVQETNVRYKRPGRGGYRQKVLQFRGVPVLGIGAGARTYTNTIDYLTGGGSQPSVSQVWDYIERVTSGESRITAGFVYDDAERIRKRLALDLFDLDLRSLEPFHVDDHGAVYEDLLAAAAQLGLARRVGGSRWQLTSSGFKYRDILSWMFFSDMVLERDREFYGTLHEANRRATASMGVDVTVSGLSTRKGPALEPPLVR